MEQKQRIAAPTTAGHTMQHFRSPPGIDPLIQADPWADAAAARHRPTMPANHIAGSDSVQTLKAQLEHSLLAKVRQTQVCHLDADGIASTVEQSIMAGRND